MIRALIYLYNRVHLPVLMPVFHALNKQDDFTLSIGVPGVSSTDSIAPFQPGDTDELRKLNVDIVSHPPAWNPDVVITGDVIPLRLGDVKRIVNIGHGLLSKGNYFTDRLNACRENLSDVLCVPGPFHRERILKSRKVFIPVVETGYPKLDYLFSPAKKSRTKQMREMGLDPGKKVVLYAPTFNPQLSSIQVLGSNVSELANEDTYLIVKLHEACTAQEKLLHEKMASSHPQILYCTGPDLTPLMNIADVMVSDVSSAFMEFMCLDKPVVLVNNPHQREFPNYDANDIEYAWRDVGIQVSTIQETVEAVNRSISDPSEYRDKRSEYSEKLLVSKKGDASDRIVEVVREVTLNYETVFQNNKETELLAMIPCNLDSLDSVHETILSLQSDYKIRFTPVIIFLEEQKQLEALERCPDMTMIGSKELMDFIRQNSNKYNYIGWFSPGILARNCWVFRLVNHLRRQSERTVVVPLGVNMGKAQEPVQNIPLPDKIQSYAEMDLFAEFSYAGGLRKPYRTPSSIVWVARAEQDLIEKVFQWSEGMENFEELGNTVAIAKDVVVNYNKQG